MVEVNIEYRVESSEPRASEIIVMDHFGLKQKGNKLVIKASIPIKDGDIVALVGKSGSGKSSILRELVRTKKARWIARVTKQCTVINLHRELPMEWMKMLAWCGLGEAYIMLGEVTTLSDGQKARLEIAEALWTEPAYIASDEFLATLDRTTAAMIAESVRKVAKEKKIGLLVATANDDIIRHLNPDITVTCTLEGTVAVQTGEEKKNYTTNSGSVKVPSPTGRTSLGGITEGTTCR